MDEEDVVYIHNRILISHKKDENLPFAAAWMELEGILLSERRQTEEDKHCTMSPVESKTTREYNKKQQITDAENWWVPRGRGWEAIMGRSSEVQTVKYKTGYKIYTTGNTANTL